MTAAGARPVAPSPPASAPGLNGRPDGQGTYRIGDHSCSGGWESQPAAAAGWRFVGDAGLLVLNKPKVSLSASGAAGNAALQQDLAAEQRQLGKVGLGLALFAGVGYAF